MGNQPTSQKPRHIAIIMDGNGRWAKKRLLPRVAGHRAAVSRVRELVRYCGQQQIEVLTLYAFSTENWRRPADEVATLMGYFSRYLKQETKRLMRNNVRLRVIGERSALADSLQEEIADAEQMTAENSGLQLNLAINYGARWEIVSAAKQLATAVAEGTLTPDAIDEDIFEQQLTTAGQPDVDLFIRTSQEWRISNFLLWQLSYAELYFPECYFPDFDIPALEQAIKWFQQRNRRFGYIQEQLEH